MIERAPEGGSERMKHAWDWGRGVNQERHVEGSLEQAWEGERVWATRRKDKATGQISRPNPGRIPGLASCSMFLPQAGTKPCASGATKELELFAFEGSQGG